MLWAFLPVGGGSVRKKMKKVPSSYVGKIASIVGVRDPQKVVGFEETK